MVGFIGADLVLSNPKTDGQITIPITSGTGIGGGTWSTARDESGCVVVERGLAASTAVEYFIMPVTVLHRTAAGKGVRLKSVTVAYSLDGGDAEADTLDFYITKQIIPKNGIAPSGTILAGDDSADYDSGHDSAGERLADGDHTLTVTIPAGERAYLGDGDQLWLMIKIADAAGGDLVFTLKGAVANVDVLMF